MGTNEDPMWKIFREHHKAKPAGFAMIGEGVQNRIKEQKDSRKSRREDTFLSNRLISDEDVESYAVKQSNGRKAGKNESDQKKMSAKELKSEQRLQQLKKWQDEKKKKIELLQNKPKPKPFKVGIVHHDTLPYKPPSPLKTLKFTAHQTTRATRSARMASNQAEISDVKKPKGTKIREQSFAPMNAKFHPPKNVMGGTMLFGMSTAPVTRSKDTFGPHAMSTRTGNRLNVASKAVTSKPPAKAVAPKPVIKAAVPKPAPKPPVKAVAPPRKTITTRPKALAIKPKITIPTINTVVADITLPSQQTFCSSIEQRNSSTPDIRTLTNSSSDAAFSTPDKSNSTYGNLSILSPFVTVARGKGNIEREKAAKMKMGYVSDNSVEKDTAIHFRSILNGEISRLNSLCEEWSEYLTTNKCTMPDSAKDHIFLVTGQTKLLISSKFEQFRNLIDRCELQECVEGGGIVTAEDLQGFWDMIFIQVENVDKRFKELCKERDAGWKEENRGVANKTSSANPNKKKVISKAKNIGPSAALKEMIKASRMKKKSDTDTEKSATASVDTLKDTKVFEGGFFKIASPMSTPGLKSMIRSSTTPGKLSSVLKNVLSSEAKKRLSMHKRMSSTPSSVALMRVSLTAKNTLSPNNQMSTIPLAPINLNATPSKSILKTKEKNTRQHRSKKDGSGLKSAKSVLFNHSGDDANASKFTIDNVSQAEPENEDRLEKENGESAEGRTNGRSRRPKKSEPQVNDRLEKENVDIAAVGRSTSRRQRSRNSESQEEERASKRRASDDGNFLLDVESLSLNTPKNAKLRSMKKNLPLLSIDALDDASATTPRRSLRLSYKK